MAKELQIRKKSEVSTWQRVKKYKWIYLMLLPALLYFIFFRVTAIVGMKLAFYDYKIVGENTFVGMKYFKMLFETPSFLNILKNTLLISSIKIFLLFPFPVIFALLLNEVGRSRFGKFVQVISYMPHFLSWVIIAGIWIDAFSQGGVVSSLMGMFGIEYKNLMVNKNAIIPILTGSEMWRSVGWDSIIYLSAILGISKELYDAAAIDGAGRWKMVKHIILPALAIPMVTVLILNVGFIMSAGLDQILNFSNDAVLSRIDIIDTYVYRIGLVNTQYSFATAASLFKGIIGTVLILATDFISKRLTGKGAW
ncbi:ABC transporter permease [Murimonas intestini]|uniref:Carbohydrate ABC transporter membrane protein 1 (CUT1 family) n=2 Tax=Murimonas intestini TaxID=1337051 RepID=A0AB73SYA7_9FIRM|nr:ABC transporter permease subunit [Murimonas intestini]MCR1885782.1 ABC transporter permease subunit [Murimonas intestini]